MNEKNLLRALEFISEGSPSKLPSALDSKAFATEAFQKETAKIAKKAKPWTRGAGIQGLGIGERIENGQQRKELALRVYVERKKPKSKVKNLVPSKVNLPNVGVCETDVLEIGRVDQEVFTDRQRPAAPGAGLGHPKVTVGTFGCLVKINESDDGLFILSNSHVLANEGVADVGDLIYQPGRLDGGKPQDSIATLFDWAEFQFSASQYNNLVDAAIAKVKNQKQVTDIIRIIGTAPVGVSKTLRRGMDVKKTGRTTDFTTGVITDINYRLFLRYKKPGGGQGTVGLRDQVLCTRYTAGGDSGSAVLNNQNRIVGLHFAGSPSTSIFNKISNVFARLSIRLP